MTIAILFIVFLVFLVIFRTVVSWSSRHDEQVRQYLLKLWIRIMVAISVVLLLAPLGMAVGAYATYRWLVGFIESLGLSHNSARTMACVGAVPFFYACVKVLNPNPLVKSFHRWVALGCIAVCFGLLFLASDGLSGDIPGRKGLVYLPGGHIGACSVSGMIDPLTGLLCRAALTPTMVKHLNTQSIGSVIVHSPTEWYGQDGKPAIWVCDKDDHGYYFVDVPYYIEPSTGKPCNPINPDKIKRYRNAVKEDRPRDHVLLTSPPASDHPPHLVSCTIQRNHSGELRPMCDPIPNHEPNEAKRIGDISRARLVE